MMTKSTEINCGAQGMLLKEPDARWGETCRLVRPATEYGLEFLALAYELQRAGAGGMAEPMRELPAYIQRANDHEQGLNLPAEHVPCSEFWLRRDDGIIVGLAELRHDLTAKLKERGGHIGYAIRPSARGKGCGTTILRLMLAEASRLGLGRVLVTCDSSNLPSARVIQKNGGRREKQTVCRNTGALVSHYWIDL